MHIIFFLFSLCQRHIIYHSLHVLLPIISHHCQYIYLTLIYPVSIIALHVLLPCIYKMNTLYTIALYALLQGRVLLPCMYYCPLYSIALYYFPVHIIALTCGVYYILYGNLCTCLAWLFGFFLIYLFHFFFNIKPVRF